MPGAMSNLGSSLKGMLFDGAGEKAIMYIYLADLSQKLTLDTEVKELTSMEQTLMSKTNKALSVAQNVGEAANASAGSLWDTIKGGLASGAKGVWDTIGIGNNSSDKLGERAKENPNFVKFTVQYNPATIKLSSVNGKVQSKRNDEGIDNLKVYKFAGKSKLSFDLIFDDCDNMNAFLTNELANANISSLVKKGANAWSHGKSDYTVRTKMDAFMSLLSSKATQQIIFYWSNMCFRGTLTDVANRYIMFNPKGNPIRGEMHIELTQDKKHKDKGYDDKYWNEAFKKCFGDGNGVGEFAGKNAGTSTFQKFTNNSFLNLNL